DRLQLDISDADLERDPYLPPYYKPGEKSDEIAYLQERRAALGGYLPSRRTTTIPLQIPSSERFGDIKRGSGKQQVATTMAFVRLLKDLMRDKEFGKRWVPIIPDEARTFGMDSLFPVQKIYSPHGQKYTSVDRELFLSYKEATTGQILHEGINEAGSVASFTAAGSSYATHGEPMIPVYIFYSMFGFQRTGDGLWAAGDQLTRGFLLGATAGRTTLNGEGLQHEDGHSHLLAATNPAVVAYDPAFAFEIAHIVEDGLHRMYGERQENIFYYLTVYNEPILQPAEPADVDVEGILKGIYRYQPAPAVSDGRAPRANILSSGTGMQWALKAQQLLAQDWGVAADVWSVTSWTELRRDAVECEEHNLLHPGNEPKVPYVQRKLADAPGPVVAVSDWMRAVPDLIARWVPGDYTSLGTDGYGLSDTRHALRRHFHVDAESITVAVLRQLALRGEVPASVPAEAAKKYAIDDVMAAPVGETGGDT
ncbi:MAG TPA: pyruvate dehydrogenase (acetyl-transferring), homodimeric type, partial [Micromonosporaceae bacterium]|nr:pyruvate dehydrogenase (acetyl-transferring), homodimeric type [Micromonosporaceae bacterium]